MKLEDIKTYILIENIEKDSSSVEIGEVKSFEEAKSNEDFIIKWVVKNKLGIYTAHISNIRIVDTDYLYSKLKIRNAEKFL